MNTRPLSLKLNSSNVVAGEGSKEAVAWVGADKPAIVALLQYIDDVVLSKLQFVGVDRSIVEHRAVSESESR